MTGKCDICNAVLSNRQPNKKGTLRNFKSRAHWSKTAQGNNAEFHVDSLRRPSATGLGVTHKLAASVVEIIYERRFHSHKSH